MAAPRAATPRGSKPAKGPTLTPTKRRELLEARLKGVADWVERRGQVAAELKDDKAAAIDAGTVFILRMNTGDLVNAYTQAAEHSPTFARGLDSVLTGGIWGQLVAVNLATLIAIGLIRGWIDPNQLPGPVRSLLPPSMFGPPPPSDEVADAEEQARREAPDNGRPQTPPRGPRVEGEGRAREPDQGEQS